MMLDRKYSADEVAEIAARGTKAMEQGGVPQVVVLAAHVAAASTLLEEALATGRPLALPDFERAAQVLQAAATLFLLVCETGPVSVGTRQ